MNMYVYIVYTHIYIHMCTESRSFLRCYRTSSYIYIYIYIYICTYIHENICVHCIHTYIHKYVYREPLIPPMLQNKTLQVKNTYIDTKSIYIYTHIHTYIYTQTATHSASDAIEQNPFSTHIYIYIHT